MPRRTSHTTYKRKVLVMGLVRGRFFAPEDANLGQASRGDRYCFRLACLLASTASGWRHRGSGGLERNEI